MEKRVLVVTCCYNEGSKIRNQLRRYPKERNYDLLIVDDGSADGSLEEATQRNAIVLRHETNQGVGSALKTAFQYAIDRNYRILVIMAGNDKDDPLEIPRLLDPIENGFDFVQGSRFLEGGVYGNMPLYRVFATRFHAWIMTLAVRKWLTESTNGFRAFRVSILKDPRIQWQQVWLDKYELEPYLLFKAITLGYKHTEVPVTKIYPPKEQGYTKMKPFTGWWSILRPLFYLWFGFKK